MANVINDVLSYINKTDLVNSAFYDIIKSSLTATGSYFYHKASIYFSNLKELPKTEEDLKFLLDGLNYLNISPDDLAKYYAHITNKGFTTKRSDLYRKYYQILSTMTLNEIRTLEDFYNENLKDPTQQTILNINLNQFNLSTSIIIDTLLDNRFIRETADINSNEPIRMFLLTELGIDFMSACTNT